MPAFVIESGKAHKISQKEFKDEQELHKLIDKNLPEIFGIRFIKDEHITDKHGRIETLGLDESNRPVVIEYKKTQEKGQLVQANRYMTWILQNPDSFELLAIKNLGNDGKNIDFANPRILCFAQEYSIDDKCLALALNAELWKYRYYENDTLIILREEEPEQLIRSSSNKPTIVKIKRQQQTPIPIEQHLASASVELVSLFNELNDRIMNTSSEIECCSSTKQIIYKTSVNFAYVQIQSRKNGLKVYLRTLHDKLKDPKKLTQTVPNRKYGNITRHFFISPNDIKEKKYTTDDIFNLFAQSYNTTQ